MNIFNLVMKALDPTVGDGKTKMIMHPETDTSQITDFAEGVRDNLLSSALAATITTLTSDSLFAKMVQLVLTATGLRYSLEQNGYICFGDLFGGLILQWVSVGSSTSPYYLTYPVSMNTFLAIAGMDFNTANNGLVYNFQNVTSNGLVLTGRRVNDTTGDSVYGNFVLIGMH